MIAGFCRPDEEENISFFCWWQGWCSFYAFFYLLLYVFWSDPSFFQRKIQVPAPCPGKFHASCGLSISFHLKKSPRFTSFRSDSDPGMTAGTIIHNSFLVFRRRFSPEFRTFFKSCGSAAAWIIQMIDDRALRRLIRRSFFYAFCNSLSISHFNSLISIFFSNFQQHNTYFEVLSARWHGKAWKGIERHRKA